MEGKKATIVISPFSSLFLLSLLNGLIISLVSSLFMDDKTFFANNYPKVYFHFWHVSPFNF
jgi:hypothetical protein